MRAATLFEALDAVVKQKCWRVEKGGEDVIKYAEWRDILMFYRKVTGAERKVKELWNQLKDVKTPDGARLARAVNQSNSLILNLEAVGEFLALNFPAYEKALKFEREGTATASLPEAEDLRRDAQ